MDSQQLAIVSATQNYVEALRDLNTLLKPIGIQVPLAMAVKV